MHNITKAKILNSKTHFQPYPYLFIKNFFQKKFVEDLNKSLPSFNDITDEGIVYQSESKTKKTVLPSSNQYKKLSKNKLFKKLNIIFEKLKQKQSQIPLFIFNNEGGIYKKPTS